MLRFDSWIRNNPEIFRTISNFSKSAYYAVLSAEEGSFSPESSKGGFA